MGSKRLPGKTLMKIFNGRPLLELVVSRFRLCRSINEIYVATSTNPADDSIVKWCEDYQIHYYRGSEDDLLDRVTKAAMPARSDGIVQMGADSAYLDFRLIDELVRMFKTDNYDYVCNDLELTYPLGIYGHVVKTEKLIELNNKERLVKGDREDVVRYIWEHPKEYSILNIIAPREYHCPQLRLTIDYPEDLQLAKNLYEHFRSTAFSTGDILELYGKHPGVFAETLHLVQERAPFFSGVKGYETMVGRGIRADGL